MAGPAFSLQLKQNIVPGLVTIGRYDGSHFCLTAATTTAKVFIHSPHRHNKEISFLNAFENVTAICAGRLKPDEEKDMLVIGSSTTLLAYHVDNNCDLFYKEMADGVTAIAIGHLGTYSGPMLIVGGNCSIQGYNWKGEDVYWTVSGDTVRSLCLVDINQDGFNELIVGSDDYEIRVFKDDAMMYEITESEAVISMIPFKDARFSYALANGTIGVYDKIHRTWRLKSKNVVRCIANFDLNGDGKEEFISGWSNGKIDARDCRTGAVVFKDALSSGIAGIVIGDYRMSGTSQVMIISETGEVRGYDSGSFSRDYSLERETNVVRDLMTKKQDLLLELKRLNAEVEPGPGIPVNTKLSLEMWAVSGNNKKNGDGHISLKISTNNDSIIRVATVFAEGMFQGETLVKHPKGEQATSCIMAEIAPPKDISTDIHIQALVCTNVNDELFHVLELSKSLPKFSMYVLVPFSAPESPESYVTFKIVERVQRLDMWLNHNFLMPTAVPVKTDGETYFEVTIATESLAIAADMVQSLAIYLNMDTLESFAEFPSAYEEIRDIFRQVDNLRENAAKISANMANNAAQTKHLVVRAEDSRILGHTRDMKECYVRLYQTNQEMAMNHKLHCGNHEDLVNASRKLNLIIQNASRLRVGKMRNEMVAECRKAVADNNVNTLVKLIKTGRN